MVVRYVDVGLELSCQMVKEAVAEGVTVVLHLGLVDVRSTRMIDVTSVGIGDIMRGTATDIDVAAGAGTFLH